MAINFPPWMDVNVHFSVTSRMRMRKGKGIIHDENHEIPSAPLLFDEVGSKEMEEEKEGTKIVACMRKEKSEIE